MSYTLTKNQSISGLGKHTMAVKGIGTVRIPAIIDGEVKEFEVNNVRYVPSIEFNLLSTRQLDISGYTHNGGNGEC